MTAVYMYSVLQCTQHKQQEEKKKYVYTVLLAILKEVHPMNIKYFNIFNNRLGKKAKCQRKFKR